MAIVFQTFVNNRTKRRHRRLILTPAVPFFGYALFFELSSSCSS